MAVPFGKQLTCPVLIGRRREQAALASLIDRARSGDGCVVLVTGEAGIGKSRLVAEAKALARTHRFLVLQGSCFPADSSTPYAPLIDLLAGFCSQRASDPADAGHDPLIAELARLLPDLALLLPSASHLPPPTQLDPQRHRRRLLTALTQFLARQARHDQPVMVIVEDLHWCDESTLEMLLHAARHARQQPLCVLLTCRSEQPSPQLHAWLAQIEREALALQLPLARLAPDDVASMLQAIFQAPAPPPSALVRAVDRLAEGVPYYVEACITSLSATAELPYANGEWRRAFELPTARERPAVPRSVLEMARQRAAQLSPPARRALTVAAIAGRRFDFPLLQRVLRCDEERLLRLLNELVAAQLLVEESADQFAFQHVLTQQAIAGALLMRERQVWHRRIVEALESLAAPHRASERRQADLALHCYAGGLWERALEHSQRAGARALERFAPYAAVEHLTHALEAAGHLAVAPPAAAYYARGQAYAALGEFDRARRDYERSLDGAEAAADGRACWQSMLALGQLWAERDYAQAGAWFQRASDRAQLLGDHSLHARSLNRLANWLVNVGRVEEGLRTHHEALRIFQSQHDTSGVAETRDLLGTTYGMLGERASAVEQLGQAIDLFRALADTPRLISSLTMRALQSMPGACETTVCPLRTRDACVQDAAEACDLARQIDAPASLAFAENALAHTLLSFGELGEALAHALASQRIAAAIDHRQWMIASAYAVGHSYLLLLAPVPAIQALDRASLLAEELGSQFWTTTIAAALGRAHIANRDLPAAQAALRTLLPPGMRPRNMAERAAVLAWGELALAQAKPDEALQIATQLIGTAPGAIPDQPLQPIPHLLKLKGESLMLLGRLEDAVFALEQARRGAQERAARPVLRAIHGSLAQAYRLLRRSDEAQREGRAARRLVGELAATIDDAPLALAFEQAALATLPSEPPPRAREAARRAFGGLTARERDVARLVAQGKTSREIAARLTVSERTAEAHVSNILGKLGFSSRTQIAVWAVERGLMDE